MFCEREILQGLIIIQQNDKFTQGSLYVGCSYLDCIGTFILCFGEDLPPMDVVDVDGTGIGGTGTRVLNEVV